ncbi:MAG: nucleotidyltransferase domain-containing protein [bacterium]|nr:MAG: nucleotidyltransferase domain-containing protein [bacterium]
MVKGIDEITALVFRYIENLKGRLRIEKVILFGSYVEGRANEHSDIDLAIISPDVNDHNLIACLQLLTRAIPRHIDIEPLAFSTHEYDSASPVELLGDIKRRGKVIYDNSLEAIDLNQ